MPAEIPIDVLEALSNECFFQFKNYLSQNSTYILKIICYNESCK